MWLTHNRSLTHSLFTDSVQRRLCVVNQIQAYPSAWEKPICSLCSSLCCLRPGVRIDAADILFSFLTSMLSVWGRHPENTHWAQGHSPTVVSLHTTAWLLPDYVELWNVCLDESDYIDCYLILSFFVSLFSRPSCLLSAVPVCICGLSVFSTAGKERSDSQTMSRQACHQTPAPALHLTQTANCTETSR